MELIQPMVKERFAKIDELDGETWEDAPVRIPVPSKINCHSQSEETE